MRVYLDNCCFNRPFDDQSQARIRLEAEAKLEVQQRIKSAEIELAWSYVLYWTTRTKPIRLTSDATSLHDGRRWRWWTWKRRPPSCGMLAIWRTVVCARKMLYTLLAPWRLAVMFF
jgi:hypothetical protein